LSGRVDTRLRQIETKPTDDRFTTVSFAYSKSAQTFLEDIMLGSVKMSDEMSFDLDFSFDLEDLTQKVGARF
jgi:hypothetical protein